MTDENRRQAKPADADARRTIARLAAETMPRLIERLMRSELGELEVRDDGWRIRLRRAGVQNGAPENVQADSKERGRHAGATSPGGHSDRGSTLRAPSPVRRGDRNRGMVTSPAVGYFLARDGISAGAKIRVGDVIGHVDVLGVQQEVVASVEGTIGAFQVEPGEAIEFGQVVARVEPLAASKPGGPADDEQLPRAVEQLVEA